MTSLRSPSHGSIEKLRGGIERVTECKKGIKNARELVKVVRTTARRCNESGLGSNTWSRAHASRSAGRRRGWRLADRKRWRRWWRLSIPLELRVRIEDMAQLVSLDEVLIVIGSNDGFQDTGIPAAVIIDPVNSVPKSVICVAE